MAYSGLPYSSPTVYNVHIHLIDFANVILLCEGASYESSEVDCFLCCRARELVVVLTSVAWLDDVITHQKGKQTIEYLFSSVMSGTSALKFLGVPFMGVLQGIFEDHNLLTDCFILLKSDKRFSSWRNSGRTRTT